MSTWWAVLSIPYLIWSEWSVTGMRVDGSISGHACQILFPRKAEKSWRLTAPDDEGPWSLLPVRWGSSGRGIHGRTAGVLAVGLRFEGAGKGSIEDDTVRSSIRSDARPWRS